MSTLWLAVGVSAGLLLGIVLRVLAKRRPAVRLRFAQSLELRVSLLAVLLLASWPVPPNPAREAVGCGALILLTFSLAVGFDGTLLRRARMFGLLAFTAIYLALSIWAYYATSSRVAEFFRSSPFQLASISVISYFIIWPIVTNHEIAFDKHMGDLRNHADALRQLIEWKRQTAASVASARTLLVVPMEKVRPELEKRLREGKEIAQRLRRYSTYDEDGIRAEHWYWHTRGLLERWFSQNDVAAEFIASKGDEFRNYREIDRNNYWRVRSVLENQVTCLEGILRRIDVYDLPVPGEIAPDGDAGPAKASEPAPSYITYRFSGPVGQLIAGQGQTVKNINSHIAAVVGQGQEAVGEALLRLSEAALSDPQLDDPSRAQILASIEDLGDAAESTPDERKHGRVRGALEMIGQVAGTATQLGEVWNQWAPVITQHMHLL